MSPLKNESGQSKRSIDSPMSPRKLMIAEALSRSRDAIKERQGPKALMLKMIKSQDEPLGTIKPLKINNAPIHRRRARNQPETCNEGTDPLSPIKTQSSEENLLVSSFASASMNTVVAELSKFAPRANV